MKKITILIAGLMLSIITAACSKTAPEGETGSNESGSTSSVNSQQNAVPNYSTLRWFDSESELAAWIADGGKWTGSWNGGWYDPSYDEEYKKNVFYNTCIENGYFPNVVAGEGYEVESILISAYGNRAVFTVCSTNEEKTGYSSNRIYVDILDSEKTKLSLEEKVKTTSRGRILTEYPESVHAVDAKNISAAGYEEHYIIDSIVQKGENGEADQILVHQTVIFAKDNLLVQAVMYPEIDSVDSLKDIFELELVYLNNSGSSVEIMNNEATEN